MRDDEASTYRGAWGGDGRARPAGGGGAGGEAGVTCLSYSMILGDMASQLLGISRGRALISVTATSQLPLCLLDTSKTFALLRFSSALGLGATAYVVAFMALRCAQRVTSVPVLAAGAVAGGAPFGGLSAGCLVYVSMLATAYIAHYNAPKFLAESGGGTDAGVARFGKLVLWAFGISALSFFSIATFGFLTFGAAASGNVLTNYATTDALASWARGAIALSLLAGYPFAFDNLRESASRRSNRPASAARPRRLGRAARRAHRRRGGSRPRLRRRLRRRHARLGDHLRDAVDHVPRRRDAEARRPREGRHVVGRRPADHHAPAGGAAPRRGRRRPRHHRHRVGVDGPRRRRAMKKLAAA